MNSPSVRVFEADLQSVGFRSGVLKGYWNVVAQNWPQVIFWIDAAAREGAPDGYYIALDLDGYRATAPTGTFWDPTTKTMLDTASRPKGAEGSRFATVFRTDWEDGRAFYHPYDRVAAHGHANWQTEQPHLVWTSGRTIVDFLEEFHALLNSGDYIGI